MKVIIFLTILVSSQAKANPLLTVKDRLRIHMWTVGLEENSLSKETPKRKDKRLPEEIERALRKL